MNDQTQSPMQAAALAYAARGWQVFPAPPGQKKSCKSAKYSGGIAWGATKDPAQIRRDFAKWPRANVAVATGPESGLFVLDVDTADGHASDGFAVLAALEALHGPLPATVMARSPSGSEHYYFAWPAGIGADDLRNSAGLVGQGIDVRAAGGMCIAAPSVKPGKGQYAWIAAPDVTPLAEAPAWLLEAAMKKHDAPDADAAPDTDTDAATDTGGFAFDTGADPRADKWAATALAAELTRVATALPGKRNSTLIAAAFNLGQLVGGGHLEEGATRAALISAGQAAGLDHDEVVATVASGMAAGIVRPRAKPKQKAAPTTAAPTAKREWPFRVVPHGVEKLIEKTDKETGEITSEWKWFASRLKVLADTREIKGESWGRLLSVTDRDGLVKIWPMPMELLAGDGTTYRERLLSMGLILAPGTFARNALHEFISTAKSDAKARAVSRVGWAGRAFVLPRETIGDSGGEKVIYQSATATDDSYRNGGTLAGWQAGVAAPAVGNSRLILALSAAFAGPLLHPTGAEGGGFHFRGGSSTGKTTALHAAGSVWGGGDPGGFVRSWRATSNGLEGIAAGHSDAILCLDELGQVDGREAGAIAYMIANGQGKSRASRNGDTRPPQTWRVLFLSTGEIGLADKISEDQRPGRRIAAGQSVRVVDLPADAGAGLGLFQDLHGAPSADAFARAIKAAAGQHYGNAARAYLEHLARGFDQIGDTVKRHVAEFVRDHCPPGADGQVSRVAARFALVAAGGEMATAFGIVPWQPGTATTAAARCLGDWLVARGGTRPAEETAAIAAVRRFLEAHGASRFEPMGDGQVDPGGATVINRAGFRRLGADGATDFLILPEAWRGDVCAGLDPVAAAKTLAACGFLTPGEGGNMQKRARLPGIGNARVYAVKAAILGGDL